MASYRQGTVAVTNGGKIVTGTDTAFITTGIYAGDIFALVDANNIPDGTLYEVASVESDTKLTLLQAYQGTTGSAKSYVIMNMAGNQTTPRFAAQVSKLLSEIQPIADALSDESVPAGIPQAGSDGKLADGWISDAAFLKTLLAFDGEANDTLTSNTGEGDVVLKGADGILEILARLSSGLSSKGKVPMLDSNNKMPANMLRITGSLSDGAIIEAGSNANGWYARLADGMQICSCIVQLGGTTYLDEITYPAAFNNIPVICPYGFGGSASGDSQPISAGVLILPINGAVTNTGATMGFYSLNGGTLASLFSFRIAVIGRWN